MSSWGSLGVIVPRPKGWKGSAVPQPGRSAPHSRTIGSERPEPSPVPHQLMFGARPLPAQGVAIDQAGHAKGTGASTPPPRTLTTESCRVLQVWTGNLIGIACARSLHFQFYAWYCWTLPLLAAESALPSWAKAAVLLTIEAVWNIFPSTPATSLALQASSPRKDGPLALARPTPLPLSGRPHTWSC